MSSPCRAGFQKRRKRALHSWLKRHLTGRVRFFFVLGGSRIPHAGPEPPLPHPEKVLLQGVTQHRFDLSRYPPPYPGLQDQDPASVNLFFSCQSPLSNEGRALNNCSSRYRLLLIVEFQPMLLRSLTDY